MLHKVKRLSVRAYKMTSKTSRVGLENHVLITTCWRTIIMTSDSLIMITGPVQIRSEKSLTDVPEETFPCWEVRSLEQSMLQNSLDAAKCLDHVSSVVVQVPQFAVVTLVCPPERILLQHLAATTHNS